MAGARKRPSIISLVQNYIEAQGSETKELLDQVNQRPVPATPSPSLSVVVPTPKVAPVEVPNPAVEEPAVSVPGVEAQPVQVADTIADGDILDRVTLDRVTLDRDTVDHDTVKQSTVKPLHSQLLDRNILDRKTSDGGTLHGHINNGELLHPETSDRGLVDRNTSNRGIANREISDRIPHEILALPYNQAAVFEYLISAGGITSARAISEATHVKLPSVRDAISRLVRRGYMHDPAVTRTAAFQGFTYILNPRMVELFKRAGGLEQNQYQPSEPSNVRRSYGQLLDHGISDPKTVSHQTQSPSHSQPIDGQSVNGQTAHSSSVLEELNLTTKSHGTVQPSTMRPSGIVTASTEGFILTGLVGLFWEDEGLTEGQAQEWCEQFGIDPKQLHVMLDWASFDLEENEKRADVKKDAVSWFFGALKRTRGCYPRPANYKSASEIRAEAVEQDLAREKEAKERLRKAELEVEFKRILENREGAEYIALFNSLSKIDKDLCSGDERMLEGYLWTKYQEGRAVNVLR